MLFIDKYIIHILLALYNHQIETNEGSNLTADVDLTVCHSLTQGVAALFGPNSPYTAHHVQSICDSKEIPHIETRCDQVSWKGISKLMHFFKGGITGSGQSESSTPSTSTPTRPR